MKNSKTISFRISKSDFEILKKEAEKNSKSVSDFIKSLIKKHTDITDVRAKLDTEFREFERGLKKIFYQSLRANFAIDAIAKKQLGEGEFKKIGEEIEKQIDGFKGGK